MFSPNTQMSKKNSLQRKSTHIHFDASNEMETEEDAQESLVDQNLKRQSQMMEEEKHERMVKKPKIDQFMQNKDRKSFGYDERFNRQAQKQQQKKQQDSKIFEQKSLQLLRQLLFYPNRTQNTLINPQIVNKWIFHESTPIKIKSFLALYMILYQFEYIQFEFRKIINLDGPEFKSIQIVEIKDNGSIKFEDMSQHQYSTYKINETKKYLTNYLEWLIWKNEQNFQTGPGNFQFWSMALNNCEKTAMQLVLSGNHRQRQRNVFLSLFLMNAGDVVFRSTLQVPKTERNIIYMTREDLSMLPKCHWLLGVNFSLRYFYKNSLENRMTSSLDLKIIDKNEISDFYHEYQLLSGYFMNQTVEFSGVQFGDKVLEWIAINSGCRKDTQKDQAKFSEILVREICSQLLGKVLNHPHDSKQLEEKMLIVVELLERDQVLKQDQKDKLLSSILYEEEKIAYKLANEFPAAISKLQHKRQAKISHLSQRLTQEYTQLYSHLILSQQPSIRNDLLTQLKHLTNIKVQKQTEEIMKRIKQIVISFNLLSHWNKEVLKTFVFIVQKYLKKLDEFITNEAQKKERMEIEQKDEKAKLKQELDTLCIFLKIRLNLESLNLQKLKNITNLIQNAQKNKTLLLFEPRTICFFKKDLLSILFSKNGFNQFLLSEVKKNFIMKGKEVTFKNIQENDLLQELGNIAQGNRYFEEQIGLLKKEAENILMH